jgi:hypothetical protein
MALEPQRIDFDQFARDLPRSFDQVTQHNQPILVERDGELYRLEKQEPLDIWEGYDPAKVREALKQAAGALAGVDRDELLCDI